MITNPHAATHAKLQAVVDANDLKENTEEEGSTPEARAKIGRVKVKRAVHYPDPDVQFDKLIRTVETKVIGVDAKVMETVSANQHGRKYAVKHYRSLKEMMASPSARKRIREVYNANQIKDLGERLMEVKAPVAGKLLEASTSFMLGLYDDEVQSTGSNTFRVQDTVLPTLNSPYSKQQLFVDYQDMHRKCWEAATRNPIAKRIVKIIPQFVLGRGVGGKIADPDHQAAWDDFFERNDWQLELKQYLRELVTYGEIFMRYFRTPEGLVARSLDPSTIWDIVTDPDDLKKVIYYHQQYVITQTSPVLQNNLVPSTLIIRHIPAADIDHFRINGTSSEKRGRSELYAILGWLLRFKEFANDRVLLNKMRAMFALDVEVGGGAAEVNAAEEQFATPPGPGAVLVHNENVKVEFKNANTNANEAKTDADMLLRIIAIGAGISENFLGAGSASTRASALISTEPDVKNFEDYQEIVEVLMRKGYKRVAKGLPATKGRFEATFGSIAQEDRSTKLKDLATAEAMDWFTKERASTMAAREFGVTSYDYDEEQAAIALERKQDPVIMQGFQSMPKVAADPNALAQQPGLAGDASGNGNPSAGTGSPVVQTSAQMGFSAKKLSGRNLADTKPTLDRGNFTRSGERASIKGQKSAGAPTYEQKEPPSKEKGWSSDARLMSLLTRRSKRLKRLTESAAVAREAGNTRKLASLTKAMGILEKTIAEMKG